METNSNPNANDINRMKKYRFITIAISSLVFFSCKKEVKENQKVKNENCDTLYWETQAHLQDKPHYYNLKDKKAMESFDKLLLCPKHETYAARYIFWNYLLHGEMDVDFSLDHLNKTDLEKTINALKVYSKDKDFPEAKYLLGVLYLNGKYVSKNEELGLRLLEESKNVEYGDFIYYNFNFRELNRQYYIPEEFVVDFPKKHQ
ncbi:MAG: hypothetical protein C4K58_05500 [Flavobacteriaceae bacterium]|nr:MAG: hypothetical protein C4K58_05500 [Flavobacteriaceae bacterium]